MPILHLVLAEAAVETVPAELWSHPSVSKNAKARGKRPGQVLLDDTYHHSAMKQAARKGHFDHLEKRGRPDILHTTLLVALESRLNKAGRLRVWVHTRNNECITIAPQLRVQRAQHRFYGLLEQLFEHGAVPPDGRADVLMAMEPETTLAQVLQQTGAARVLVLNEHGSDYGAADLFRDQVEDVAMVVGAFPTGELVSDLAPVPHTSVALGPAPLTAWAVAGELATRFLMEEPGEA